MLRVAVVTDTDASLPDWLAARYGIWQVPINIHFGDQTLRAAIDIDDAQLFERVNREGKLPTTSAPSPGQFVEVFERAFERGADALACFCVSSAVSATHNAALVAQELMPGHDITVVDTNTLTIGQGLMVLSAAEAVEQGASKSKPSRAPGMWATAPSCTRPCPL